MLHVTLVCVGRLKAGPERDLVDRYIQRAQAAGRALGLAIDTREIDESRSRRPEDRKSDESKAIDATLPAGAKLVAFDEGGANFDSLAFARLLAEARDSGVSSLALVIGGPDGLDPVFRQRANGVLAFGAATWPHQLARIMASEQIYRATTILSGHPYHRV